MIYNIPIENIPERYSAQWNVWIPRELEAMGVPFVNVMPDYSSYAVREGEFLDAVATNIYKARQLQTLLQYIEAGNVKAGDVLFFHDLWFPGLEALFYVRNATGLDFKIAGLLHAGTYDPHDRLTAWGMEGWAAVQESVWFNEVDLIFLATHFHRELLSCRLRPSARTEIEVLGGFPLYLQDVVAQHMKHASEHENIVVFPHRLAPEKQPDVFGRLASFLLARPEFRDWRFVRTKDVCKTKGEYYSLLGRAKVAVSCALQETWGIAQQEATLLGCVPIVPDRLSYRELYPDEYRYATFEELVDMVYYAATDYVNAYADIVRAAALFTVNNEAALARIVGSMRARNWRV